MPQKFLAFLLFAFFSVVLAGCDSLPEQLKQRVEQIPTKIENLERYLESEKKSFALKQGAKDWQFFAPYAKREKWNQKFTEAKAKVERLRFVYKARIKPIYDRNSSKDIKELESQLKLFDEAFRSAKRAIAWVGKRMTTLATAKDKASEWITRARKEAEEMKKIVSSVESVVEKAKRDYPNRKGDISGLFAPLQRARDEALSALKKAESEFAKHKKGELADYAVFADSVALVDARLKGLRESANGLHKKLGELYREYTKILADMKVEYWIQIGRSSWDSWSDWDNTPDMLYKPVQVSEQVFRYFSKLKPGEWRGEAGNLARLYKGFGGWKLEIHIDPKMWAALGFTKDKLSLNWPKGDDDSSFWVEDMEPRFFHKYLIIENGVKKYTDWIEVDEEDFDEYLHALGMEIVSKPYGFFESEKLQEPTPMGLSKVGNPKYGRWEKDPETGKERWSWLETYAIYRLFFDPAHPTYYYRDEYRYWRDNYRGKRGYYGRDEKKPTYGTFGKRTRTSSRFAKTSFAKRGGFKSASIRGAGSGFRGRGPGGRGK